MGEINSIGECFVAVYQIFYNDFTPLKAVELCFKIIHSLNAQYPVEVDYIWLCIQKHIFKIENVSCSRRNISKTLALKNQNCALDYYEMI